MARATAEERALARAAMYRTLALAFSYPTGDVIRELKGAFEVASVAAELLDEDTRLAVGRASAALEALDRAELEEAYQRTFTLSYSEDCPLYETAFSASHLFQQAQQQADLAGFYRAFGVVGRMERPDHLSVECEFGYLLAVREARARSRREPEHLEVSRDAARKFFSQHLARWAPLVGQRMSVTGAGTWYEAASAALLAFVAWEERFLRVGTVVRFRDEPVLISDEPGDMSCPLAESAAAEILDLPEAWKEPQRAG